MKPYIELVASFVNRSKAVKTWEKTDICEVSTSGVHSPKNTALTRIPVHTLPRSSTHFLTVLLLYVTVAL